MKIRLNSSLLFTLILLASCHKESIYDQVRGKWDWVKSVSPYLGHITDPANAGYSQSIEFRKDGTLNEYKNDTLVASSKYSIKTDPSSDTYVLTNTILPATFYFRKDTLIFDDAYVDGPVSYYLRIK